ncbi:MAG: hypothetical protein PVG39_00915 [Desulfobacteraceae bacterium]|jgi:hypothetical protein
MNVKNMRSPKGNHIPNQFIITHKTTKTTVKVFQSYHSIIVKIVKKTGKPSTAYLDKNFWDYSVTTGKYRNMFLGENKADTQRKIENGTYKLVDLNK